MFSKNNYLLPLIFLVNTFYISSCAKLPKQPNNQYKTILIVKDDFKNSSKHNAQIIFNFKLKNNDGIEDNFRITPSDSIHIYKSLNPGSYTINGLETSPVGRASRGKKKHNLYHSFKLNYGQITILDKKLSYTQEAYGSGGWKSNWKKNNLLFFRRC